MRRRVLPVIVAIGLAALAPLSAQQTKAPNPNFSGLWHPASTPYDPNQAQLIDHTETELILRHGSPGGGHRNRYVLDGKPKTIDLGSNSTSVSTATVTPTGVKIETSASYGGPSKRQVHTVQVWTINAKGQLVIQVSKTENGETEKDLLVYEKLAPRSALRAVALSKVQGVGRPGSPSADGPSAGPCVCHGASAVPASGVPD